jgi:hypothetical protein
MLTWLLNAPLTGSCTPRIWAAVEVRTTEKVCEPASAAVKV